MQADKLVTLVHLGSSDADSWHRSLETWSKEPFAEFLAVAPLEWPWPESVPTCTRQSPESTRVKDMASSLDHVVTKWAVLVDGSLVPKPNYIQSLLEESSGPGRVRMVAPKLRADESTIASVGSGLGGSFRWYDRGGGEKDQGQYDAHREVFCTTLLGCLVHMDWYRESGGIDTSYASSHADIDLTLGVILKGYSIRFAPEAVAIRQTGAPGADRNPQEPLPAIEWERLRVVAHRHPRQLLQALMLAAPSLGSLADARDRLRDILSVWAPLQTQAETIDGLIDMVERDPRDVFARLQEIDDAYEPFPYEPMNPEDVTEPT